LWIAVIVKKRYNIRTGGVRVRKKFIFSAIVLGLIALVSFGVLAADIYIDDRRMRTEVSPIVVDGSIYVPLEEICEYLELDLSWNFAGPRVRGKVGGENFNISDPVVIRGNLLVTLEFIEDYLGFSTEWDEKGEVVDIHTEERSRDDFRRDDGILVQVKTDSSQYRYGDKIAVSLLIFNNSSSEKTLEFNTGQTYDLTMKRGDRVVWQWSQDKSFTQAFQSKTLEPFEFKLYTFKIDTERIRTFVTGNYTLEGVLTVHRDPIRSEPLSINIQR